MRLLAVLAVLLAACSDNNVTGSGGAGGSGTGGSGGAIGSGGSGGATGGTGGSSAGASVIEHHGNPARTGLYIAPNLTKTAAMGLTLDSSFHPTVMGPTYAQALFVDGGTGGRDLVIVATEQNQVSAFDASNGQAVWQRVLVAPRPLNQQPCGNRFVTPIYAKGRIFVAADDAVYAFKTN